MISEVFNKKSNAAYNIILNQYRDQRAKRSGVLLMQHIDEGLYILGKVCPAIRVMEAYCLHPVVQNDDMLKPALRYHALDKVAQETVVYAMEYRHIANAYLSKRSIESIEEIALSPLKGVNAMLIADKIQNRKDFDLYHKGTHDRSAELDQYFQNWLRRLGVSEEEYQQWFTELNEKFPKV